MPFVFPPQLMTPEIKKDWTENPSFTAGLGPFLKFVSTAGLSSLGGFSPNQGNTMPTNMTQSGTTGNTIIDRLLESMRMGIPSLGGKIPGVGSTNSANTSSAPSWLIPLLIGLTSTAGGLANRSSTTTATPTQDPASKDFMDQLIKQYSDMMNKDVDLSGYTASGLSDINRSYDLQKMNTQANLSARGISGPASDNAMRTVDNNRFSEGLRFRQGIPLLQRNMQSDLLSKASGLFSSLPRGVETKTSGNVLGGAFGGGAEALALLYGMGAFSR